MLPQAPCWGMLACMYASKLTEPGVTWFQLQLHCTPGRGMQAMIAPTILAINSINAGQMPRGEVIASVAILTVGILIATVTDAQVMSNMAGMLVGVASVISTALYNILAGHKQKTLGASVSPPPVVDCVTTSLRLEPPPSLLPARPPL